MRFATTVIVMLGLPLIATAAETMKPGLWEVTMKSDMVSQMPDIPPEQIDQMRKLGVVTPTKRDGAIVQEICITKKMAERDQPHFLGAAREQSACKLKNQSHSGNSYRADLVCDSPNVKGTGIIKGTFSSNEGYSSTYDFNGTAYGREVNQHHEANGKWLTSDCGNVKPIDALMGAKK